MKYLAVAEISLRQSLTTRGAAFARLAFYLVLLLIFSRLWAAVGAGTSRVGVGPAELIWYLAITELVTLSTPFLYMSIEEDVRRGDIAYQLARPTSYLLTKLAEGVGEMTTRFLFLATFGLAGAWLFAGGLPGDPRSLLLAVPIAYLATLVMLVMQAGVGLSSFWVQDAAPVHWITQKFAFVFGGLMFPLEIYPEWMRTIAAATPFSATLYGCARLTFEFDPALAAWTALRIVAWGLLILGIVLWLNRLGERILNINGG